MGLPLKLLPAAYTKWSILEPSRPCKILPVTTEEYTPPGGNPRVVSSVLGKIDTLVLYYPGFHESKELRIYRYTEFMLELVSAMKGMDRKFVLVVRKGYPLSGELEQELKQNATNAGHALEVIYIDYARTNLSPWIQDAFLPIQYQLKDGTYKTYLVESILNKVNESAKSVVSASNSNPTSSIKGLEYQKSNLPFVGGNVLAGDGFVLIGLHDSSHSALEKIGKKWIGNYILLSSELPEFFASWPQGKYINNVLHYLQCKSENQIIYHIDLFITLAGKGRRRRNTEFFVIGAPCIGFDGLESASEELQDTVRAIIEETRKAICTIIRQIEVGMRQLGKRYKIIRNPLPLTYYDQVEEKDKVKTKVRYFCWATYNNCLVEQYREGNTPVHRVFLPSYGISSDYSSYPESSNTKYGNWKDLHVYDLKNKEIWEKKLGYEVVLLRTDYNPFAKYQGSLNCLTNCIVRKINI